MLSYLPARDLCQPQCLGKRAVETENKRSKEVMEIWAYTMIHSTIIFRGLYVFIEDLETMLDPRLHPR